MRESVENSDTSLGSINHSIHSSDHPATSVNPQSVPPQHQHQQHQQLHYSHHQEGHVRNEEEGIALSLPNQRQQLLLHGLRNILRRQMEQELMKQRKIVLHETTNRPRIEIDVPRVFQNIKSAQLLFTRVKGKIDQRAISNPFAKVAIALAATAMVKHHVNLLTFAAMSNFAQKNVLPIIRSGVNVGGCQRAPLNPLQPPHFLTNAFYPNRANCHHHHTASCHLQNHGDHHHHHHDQQYHGPNNDLAYASNNEHIEKQEPTKNSAISDTIAPQDSKKEKILLIQTSIDPANILPELLSNEKERKNSSLFHEKKMQKSAKVISYQEMVKSNLKDSSNLNTTNLVKSNNLHMVYHSNEIMKEQVNNSDSDNNNNKNNNIISESFNEKVPQVLERDGNITSNQVTNSKQEYNVNQIPGEGEIRKAKLVETEDLKGVSVFGLPNPNFWKET